jgi:Reverse transcriptase (RNA-dependent DNA polymerase)
VIVQSDLPEPIYVELPPGGYKNHPVNQGKVLEITKSLYGDERALKLSYKHLRDALFKLGFVMDKQDCCLFTMKGCIFVVYVDDAIIVAKDQSTLNNVLDNLTAEGLDIERMGTV